MAESSRKKTEKKHFGKLKTNQILFLLIFFETEAKDYYQYKKAWLSNTSLCRVIDCNVS